LVSSLTLTLCLIRTHLLFVEPLQKLLLCCLSSWALLRLCPQHFFYRAPSHCLEHGSSTSWLSLALALCCHPWTSLVTLALAYSAPSTHSLLASPHLAVWLIYPGGPPAFIHMHATHWLHHSYLHLVLCKLTRTRLTLNH
jgi:hypothetical protein